MPQDRGFYAYGGFPLGFEVGQRTDSFRGDWPVRATASLYGRDLRALTRVRQRALVARRSLGFAALPAWMAGSARAVARAEDGSVPYPDGGVLHALRDVLAGTPAALLALAARFSRDAGPSLCTGAAWPRTAYRLPAVGTAGALQLPDGRHVRAADSLWDFLTAFDPVSLPADDGSLVLRNLDAPSLQTAPAPPGFEDGARVGFPGAPCLPDGPAAAVWDNARSLSDDGYLPPVMTVSPVAPGLDLACDRLWPDAVGPWADAGSRPAYPVPLQPGLVYADAPTQWPRLTAPGLLPAVPPADGLHRLLLPGDVRGDGWELFSAAGSLGRATPCALSNGWDDAGEYVRLPRREGEDDLVYGGRQQRLWMAAVLNTELGAATPSGQERLLSAGLCLSVIVPAWDGAGFALPAGTTQVDALDYPLTGAVLSLSTGQLLARDATTLTALQDLNSYRHVHALSGDARLRPGTDYVVGDDGVTVLLAAPPAGPVLDVIASGRRPFRLDDEEAPTALSPEPHRAPGAWSGPLLLSRGPRVRTSDAVRSSLLLEPDGAAPTPLGRGVSGHVTAPTWAASPAAGPPAATPPFDLDAGVLT